MFFEFNDVFQNALKAVLNLSPSSAGDSDHTHTVVMYSMDKTT